MTYKCKYGLYHDKPCINNEPKSNNGWIYSSFARKLGFPLSQFNLDKVYNLCLIKDKPLLVNRLPAKYTPYISRDEIIGMTSLGVMGYKTLEDNGFRFYRSDIKVPLLRQIKAVWSLRGKHRNYVWQNKITDAYPIVFKLAAHDRYYIKTFHGYGTTVMETIAFYLYIITSLLKKKAGDNNILWLQLTDLNHRAKVLIDRKKYFLEYFGKDHVFNKPPCDFCDVSCGNSHCTKEK